MIPCVYIGPALWWTVNISCLSCPRFHIEFLQNVTYIISDIMKSYVCYYVENNNDLFVKFVWNIFLLLLKPIVRNAHFALWVMSQN